MILKCFDEKILMVIDKATATTNLKCRGVWKLNNIVRLYLLLTKCYIILIVITLLF